MILRARIWSEVLDDEEFDMRNFGAKDRVHAEPAKTQSITTPEMLYRWVQMFLDEGGFHGTEVTVMGGGSRKRWKGLLGRQMLMR